jgi:aspartate aminotransferase
MVGVIPGRPFGNDEYVRISYATSEQEIQEGLRRLGEFISG